jgi:hypothetical protein
VWLEQAAVGSFCTYALVAEIGGERTEWGSHRAAQLVLVITSSLASGVLVWNVPKRQFVYLIAGTSVPLLFFACDAIWSCSALHTITRMVGMGSLMPALASMRKLVARFKFGMEKQVAQVARLEGILFAAYALSCGLQFAFSGSIVLSAMEIVAAFLITLCAWKHFSAFVLASNETFSAAKGAKGCARDTISTKQRVLLVQQARASLGSNVAMLLILVHFALGFVVLFSPALAINEMDGCKVRPRSTIRGLEAARFYMCHIVTCILIVATCHATVAFTAARRRRQRQATVKKSDRGGAGHAIDSYANASSAAST